MLSKDFPSKSVMWLTAVMLMTQKRNNEPGANKPKKKIVLLLIIIITMCTSLSYFNKKVGVGVDSRKNN